MAGKGLNRLDQGTVLNLDRHQNAAVNFSVLKRMDPACEEITSLVNHSSVYELVDERWEKKDIEGPVFLVRRGVAPSHRIFVLNRVGRTNFAIDVHGSFDVDLATPGRYMFRDKSTSPPRVNMMWFPDSEAADGLAFMTAFKQLVKSAPHAVASAGAQDYTSGGPAAAPPKLAQVPSMDKSRSAAVHGNVANSAGMMSPSVAALFGGGESAGPSTRSAPLAASSAVTGHGAAHVSNSAPTSASQPVYRGAGTRGRGPENIMGMLMGPAAAGPSIAPVAPSASSAAQTALSKQALKEAVMDLMADDAFLELLHTKYKLAAVRLLKAQRLGAGAVAGPDGGGGSGT